MFDLLHDPLSVIKDIKKQSYTRVFLYLLAASMFTTVGVMFFVWRYFGSLISMDRLVTAVLGILFSLIAAHVFVAFFYALALHILDGKGGYYEGLAAVVLGFVAPAVFIFFAGAVSYIPYGVYVSVLLLAYGYVVGTATLFRATKEYFQLDYAGVLIGFLITAFTLGFAGGLVSFLV